MDRYARNYSSITNEEQEILMNTRVAIVGLGGLGGYVLENLVRLGVKSFNLIDRDVFEESNLNRQILSTEMTLGMRKAEEGFRRAKTIDRSVEARVFNAELDENSFEMLEGADIVVDCLDSIDSRLKLESLCEKMGLTLIHGAIRGYYGQVAISSPGHRILKKIYRDLKRDRESLGNLPMTCMVTASLQVNLLLKVVLNEKLVKDLILIDVKNMEIERLKLQ